MLLKGNIHDVGFYPLGENNLSMSYIIIKYKEDGEIKIIESDSEQLKNSGLNTNIFSYLKLSNENKKSNQLFLYGLIGKNVEIDKQYLYSSTTNKDSIEYEVNIIDDIYNINKNTFTLFDK